MQVSSLPLTETGKRKFPGISLKAITHKLDLMASENLKKIPLLPQLLKFLNKIFTEESLYVVFTGQALRITPKQYPRLYKVYREAIEVLDLPYEPEFFLQTSDTINAFAIGMERKFVVITSGIAELLTEEELLFVIGHELGHNKFDHMLNKTISTVIGSLGVGILSAALGGVGQLAALSLQLGLLHWSRMAEFSADRAGFLVVQDRTVALKALAKLAGYTQKYSDEDINIEEVLSQARQLDETNLLQTIHKYIAMVQMTHPFIPYRLKELDLWISSPEAQSIINGSYVTEEEFNRRFAAQYPPVYQGYQQMPYYGQYPFQQSQQPSPYQYPQQYQYNQPTYQPQFYQQPYNPSYQQPPYPQYNQPYQQYNPQSQTQSQTQMQLESQRLSSNPNNP